MQAYASQIKQQVWGNLHTIFLKYTQGNQSINTVQISSIITQILLGDQYEVEYVVKNLFRVDIDGNGSIDFPQFANFLLRRHVGQIALQKEHRSGLISNSKKYSLNAKEFNTVLNKAYSFLNVTVTPEESDTIFVDVDTDKDGLITYVEYFQFINKYLCKSSEEVEEEKKEDSGKEINSRLRNLIWSLLRKLYNQYDQDHNKELDEQQIEKLISDILKLSSKSDINFVLFDLYKIGSKGHITFEQFANYFIWHLGNLGLSKFSQFHNIFARKLNKDQFVAVFRQSFNFLDLSSVRDSVLHLIFGKIDADSDGWISFDEYLAWVKQFLSPEKVFSTKYFVAEDDANNHEYDSLWDESGKGSSKYTKKSSKVGSGSNSDMPFKFSNHGLANRVRKQTYKLLIEFDENKNQEFETDQIIQILKVLLKEVEDEIKYVIRNVFRYDKNSDGKVTYDQFANFFLEQHCGEMAIQRFHRQNKYSRGADRLMNQAQFVFTINYALSFIHIQGTPEELSTIFKEVDTNNDGFITYVEYFTFLKYYFGSLSLSAQHNGQYDGGVSEIKNEDKISDPVTEANNITKSKLSPLDRFVNLVLTQFKVMVLQFDANKNLQLENDQINAIATEVFNLSESERDYVLRMLFNHNSLKNEFISYDQGIFFLLRYFVGQKTLKKLHNEHKFAKWQEKLLNLQDFILLVNTGLCFLPVKPDVDLLAQIFKFIDTNNDGWISYKEYYSFIKKYLGNDDNFDLDETFLEPENNESADIYESAEFLEFYKQMWSELKTIFDHYDTNSKGYLDEGDLKKLVTQILKETTQRQLNYVFWNLFRVDINTDKKIQFQQFAPFILKHSAELGLQRFHVYQTIGTKKLTPQEFISVMRAAYDYLKSIPKKEEFLRKVFNLLDGDKDGQLTYTQYFTWVYQHVSKRR